MVHALPLDEHDMLVRDARDMTGPVFKLIYGPEVYRYFAPDNSVRIVCTFKEPVVTPYVAKKGERIDPPRVRDKIVLIEDGEELFGHITYVDKDDDCFGAFIYSTKALETFPLDCLETCRERGAKWRIHQ